MSAGAGGLRCGAAGALQLGEQEVGLLVRADQGEAGPEAEVGALFALAALRDARAAVPANSGGGQR